MIISVKWNDKNSTFKIGEYTFINTAVHFNTQSRFTQHHDTSSLDLAIFLTVYIYPSRPSFLPPLLVLIISVLTEIQESILEQHWKLVS